MVSQCCHLKVEDPFHVGQISLKVLLMFRPTLAISMFVVFCCLSFFSEISSILPMLAIFHVLPKLEISQASRFGHSKMRPWLTCSKVFSSFGEYKGVSHGNLEGLTRFLDLGRFWCVWRAQSVFGWARQLNSLVNLFAR